MLGSRVRARAGNSGEMMAIWPSMVIIILIIIITGFYTDGDNAL